MTFLLIGSVNYNPSNNLEKRAQFVPSSPLRRPQLGAHSVPNNIVVRCEPDWDVPLLLLLLLIVIVILSGTVQVVEMGRGGYLGDRLPFGTSRDMRNIIVRFSNYESASGFGGTGTVHS